MEFLKKGPEGRELIIKKESVSDPANPTAPPVEVTRILTPEEFARENARALDMAPNGQVFETPKRDPACFVGDVLVYTDHGPSHIVDLVPGTMVLSRSEATGEIGYRRVVQKFDHGKRDVFTVWYQHENGTRDGVTTTPEHPFWVVGKGWVPAGELQIGQELEICDPESGTFYGDRPGGLQGVLAQRLRGIRSKATIYELGPIEDRKYAVYNLEVEEFHTYFVGDLGAWVHNKNPEKQEP